MDIEKALFAVVDVETTGMGEADEIVEIAAEYMHGTKRQGLATFERCAPEYAKISIESMAVHHITPFMVNACRAPQEVVPRILLLNVGEDAPDGFVAHNAEFDEAFCKRASQYARHWPRPWICTMRMAKQLWPGLPSYGLQHLRYWCHLLEIEGLQEGWAPHSAAYDAVCCAALFEHMLGVMRERRLYVTTVEELYRWAEQPVLLPHFGFGKHAEVPVRDIPSGYLRWMRGQSTEGEGWDRDVLFTLAAAADGVYATIEEMHPWK